MKAVVLNAYRRSNAGDGLLVDETVSLLREAHPGVEITLVSMEPSSFPEYGVGLHPVAGNSETMTPRHLLARLLTGRAHPAVMRAIAGADLAVAVGGGYIRADTWSAAAKSYLSHVVQAPTRQSTTPYIYLPQSIGPLPHPSIPFVSRRLARAFRVFVRDDRSARELEHHGVPTRRLPDLAAISMGSIDVSSLPTRTGSRAALIARALPGDRHYRSALRALRDALDPEILLQSSGAGNDDRTFYESMGWGTSHRSAREALSAGDAPGVVVSVRLHGGLQAMLAGVPAIHLSYERKGWGAFEDLGIAEYVHNARSFDPDVINLQVEELRAQPQKYWQRIGQRQPYLKSAHAHLVRALREAVTDSASPR